MDAGQQIAGNSNSKVDPVAVCMSCRSEFPLDTGMCPNCHVSLSLVRNCPGCGQILSAKHATCLYCGYIFVEPVSTASPATGAASRERRRPLGRRIAAIVVSVGVFLAVFVGATLFTRYEDHRVSLPPTIATSYALRDSTIYREAIRSSAELGHVKGTDVVYIVGYRLEGEELQWYQVAWKGRPGYTPAKNFAPPKVEKAEGSRLLQLAIVQLPSELVGLGREAVGYYRDKFPQSRDGDRLTWILAERIRQLSVAKHNQDLAEQAREEYRQLASQGGEIGEQARKRLQDLRAWPAATAFSSGEKSVAPEIEIESGSTYTGSPMRTGAQQITLVDQTEVTVRLPLLADIVEGTELQGQVAKPVQAGNQVVVRAGSVCNLRIVRVMRDQKTALLQVISLEIGNRRLAVSPPPVAVQISPLRQKPVTFRVATPLLVPN